MNHSTILLKSTSMTTVMLCLHGGEMGDLLLDVILVHGEVFRFQAGEDVSLFVGYQHLKVHQVNGYGNLGLAPGRRLLIGLLARLRPLQNKRIPDRRGQLQPPPDPVAAEEGRNKEPTGKGPKR